VVQVCKYDDVINDAYVELPATVIVRATVSLCSCVPMEELCLTHFKCQSLQAAVIHSQRKPTTLRVLHTFWMLCMRYCNSL